MRSLSTCTVLDRSVRYETYRDEIKLLLEAAVANVSCTEPGCSLVYACGNFTNPLIDTMSLAMEAVADANESLVRDLS
jgi:hypothetical protein